MKEKTYEGTKKTQNGLKRMFFSVLAILLQAVFMVYMFTRLNEYAAAINTTTSVLAIILVLGLYNREQTASMTTPWIILILAFPIMGVSLYLLVGLNGAPNKMRLSLVGSEMCIRDRLSDLSKARKFIFMEYHAIEDKESWHRIQKVLTERVQAGVEVRVFYDDMGSIFFIDRDFSEKMEKLGIKCRVFNPVAPAFNMFLNNRDHRKITVIDGKIAYTGGYNLANEYFNVTHPYGIWKDTGIRLEGDAVKSFTIAFLEMWNASERKVPREVDVSQYLLHYDYEAKQSGFIQPYADSPLDNEQVGEDVYISMANKAQRYCWFITPYLIITDEMSHALTLAAKRGVDVRIITPGIPDKKPIYSVTRSFYNQLVKHGVRIFEWTPGFCHAKMSVADDIMATCGTINLDYRSLYHHFENGCFMADCEVVHEIRDDFIRLFTESAEVTEKYRTGRSARRRLGQSIMRLFAGLL